MSLTRTVSEIFSVQLYWRDLAIWVRGHSTTLEMAPFDRSHKSSYRRSVDTMALYYIISEIKRDIGQKSRFFNTIYQHSMSPLGGGRRRNIVMRFRV